MEKNAKGRKTAKDRFERTIDYLRISITDRCNLSCVYCSPKRRERNFPDKELLGPHEIARFVRTAHAHGLRKVRVTGGEPLLRKDVIDIISAVKDVGVGDISLTTNGLLLGGMARRLKKAGLDRVNISLDTLHADKYASMTGGGSIGRVWDAIRSAEDAGLTPIKINVVPIRGVNDDEVVEFGSLTLSSDYHIRFIEYMPVGRKNICLKGVCVKKDELLKRLSTLGSLEHLAFKGGGPARNYRIEGAKGIIGIISPVSEHFCDSCNRLRLTANGKLKPCLLADVTIDVREALRAGADDAELEALFLEALNVKPEGHRLGKEGTFGGVSSMSQIGG